MIRAGATALAPMALCAALPALAQPDGALPGPGLASVEYGIYCAPRSVGRAEAPGTASGEINLVAEVPPIRWRQTTVPADFAIGFGVVVTSEGNRLLDPVIVTVTHPPFPGSGIEVEQWITTIEAEGRSLMGFSFEYDHELVPGPWSFRAEHDGETLFDIAFQVVPGSMLPEIPLACLGGAVS